jgi:predicted Holliday junction resolvase-like endonuclease
MLLSINKNIFLKRSFSVLILIVFLLFITVNFLSLHIHTLEDGTQIVHSHLINSSSTESENHSHTQSELNYYFLISIIGKCLDFLPFVFVIISLLVIYLLYKLFKKIQAEFANLSLLRAPPKFIQI